MRPIFMITFALLMTSFLPRGASAETLFSRIIADPLPIRLLLPPSQTRTSVALCQSEISPAGSTPYNLTVEAYTNSSIAQDDAFTDFNGIVTQVHQTTNNVFRRDSESAAISRSTSSGITNITIDTQSFRGCVDCYTLKITNGPSGGRVLTGTLQFAGSSATYSIDCGTAF